MFHVEVMHAPNDAQQTIKSRLRSIILVTLFCAVSIIIKGVPTTSADVAILVTHAANEGSLQDFSRSALGDLRSLFIADSCL